SAERKVLLAKRGRQWRLKVPEGEIEGWKVTSVLWRLKDLEYIDELEGGGKLALRGLKPPLYKVILRLKKGKELSLYLGEEVPQKEDRLYALNPVDEKVYIIKKEFLDTLNKYLFEVL
ncbi:MAG: hypothetical protein DRG50_02230, partial [Deltaproteobacteria bacterium]